MRLLDLAAAVLMVFGVFGLGGAVLGGGVVSAAIGVGMMLPYVALNIYRGYTTAGTPTPAAE